MSTDLSEEDMQTLLTKAFIPENVSEVSKVIGTFDTHSKAYTSYKYSPRYPYHPTGVSSTFVRFMCNQDITREVMQRWRQTLAQCECCTRHMSNRSNLEARELTKVYIGNEYCQGQCLCPCRHYARILETACEQKEEEEADI